MRLRPLAVLALLVLSFAAVPSPVAAADGLTMEARTLLDGHARVGSWMAVAVRLKNDGPAIDGELRLAGGAQGKTRFGQIVDLPTQSDKTFVMYTQPPAFGRELEVTLVSDDQVVASTKAPFKIHDGSQLAVGVIAERPGDIIGGIDLIPNQNQQGPVLVPLRPEDLPERVEAWSGLDRLIWQDTDSNRLTPAQSNALRGWLAGGGRLIIVGGTTGPNTLSAFPDDLLPYRPTATVDVAPTSLGGLLGTLPATATDVPALGGDAASARVLATSGDRTIAAERPYGNGAVTLIGFDPTTDWVAQSGGAANLWRMALPPRTVSGLVFSDDTQLVSAVAQLPALALPPIGGLIALLAAYILLVGPVNYLVLRRLDRREWAWVTMPVLIGVFAVGAYAFGSLLRGSDLLVNEVAVVRGAPGTTDGSAQVYVGVFSPSRGTYQISVPGGALLSPPISGEVFGGTGAVAALDVLQGDPAQVRDLAVGFGSLRTIRAETPIAVPLVEADLRLEDGRVRGTVRNASQVTLEDPAVVLGQTVARLKTLAPGAEAEVDAPLVPNQFGPPLSDRVVGPIFFGDQGTIDASMTATYIRHTIVDQLSYDPNWGTTNQLPTDGAVILAWGSGSLLPIEVAGQQPRMSGNVLYYMPAPIAIRGQTTFRGDLLRSSVVDTDAAFFGKDPMSMNFGRGSATLAYRPLPFEGTFTPTELTFSLGFGGEFGRPIVAPKPIEPLPEIPAPCPDPPTGDCAPVIFDGMPEVEFFDRLAGEWVRLPHADPESRYKLEEPVRYIDPASGAVLVRFVNDRQEGVGFAFDLSMTGNVQ